MTARVVVIAWLVAAALAGPAVAGPYEDGVSALDRGDNAAAVKKFRQAAGQGIALGQYFLGTLYDTGQGVSLDHVEAAKWYRKAADQGDDVARIALGFRYHTGVGMPRDDAEAMKWFHKAAEQGDDVAQSNLGFMYERGEGVVQDHVQAYKWFSLAAAQSPASEKEDGDEALRNRDRVAANMTPAQIAEARKLAREWKPKPSICPTAKPRCDN